VDLPHVLGRVRTEIRTGGFRRRSGTGTCDGSDRGLVIAGHGGLPALTARRRLFRRNRILLGDLRLLGRRGHRPQRDDRPSENPLGFLLAQGPGRLQEVLLHESVRLRGGSTAHRCRTALTTLTFESRASMPAAKWPRSGASRAAVSRRQVPSLSLNDRSFPLT